MQNGKDDIHVDRAVGSAACGRGIGLKRDHSRLPGFGRDYNCFAAGQHCGPRGYVWIARAQVARFVVQRLALQEPLGVRGCNPPPFFSDADGHDVVFLLIYGLENRGRRKQRNFVLSAASTEQDSHSNLFHELSVWGSMSFTSILDEDGFGSPRGRGLQNGIASAWS